MLLLGPTSNIPLLNISLQRQLIITLWVATGACSNWYNQAIILDDVYSFPDTQSKFTAFGCDTSAFMSDPDGKTFQSGCVSLCTNISNIIDGSCSGIGCCQTSIPKGLRTLHIDLGSYYDHTLAWNFNPCSYAFLAEQDCFKFSLSDIWNLSNNNHLTFQNPTSAPVLLDWVVGLETCEKVGKIQQTILVGETATVLTQQMAQDIAATAMKAIKETHIFPMDAKMLMSVLIRKTNPVKEYALIHQGVTSVFDTIDDGEIDGVRCIPAHQTQFPILQFTLGRSPVTSLGWRRSLVSAHCCFLDVLGHPKKEAHQTEKKISSKNGGLLLQQHLSLRERSVETTKIFTAEELKIATDKFDESNVLGRGGYGTVYKGILADKTVVAIKRSKVIDESQIEQFINEVVILSQINHKNVVRLLGCCLETQVPLLVYEFITNGTLHHHIHDCSFSWENRLRIAAETAGALAYLHSAASPPIIHRDIKSPNILEDNHLRAKVSDFDASRLVPLDQTQLSTLMQGTLGYLDPQYFLTSQLTEKSDVYSFGIVLAELMTGKQALLFDRQEEERNLAMYFISSMKENCLSNILDDRIFQEMNDNRIIQVAELAKSCLKMSGDERPTMKEVAMELEGLRSILG
ncbi:wall-associated kinase, putative [Ricinus communis]|uniref:Wall-associated kinase, putative n=1 Tax=Ricinus communis TaxID=3988 RepID=B9R8V4_RICCO|nr:wall-associated kinase, putative [Ricinus communis]